MPILESNSTVHWYILESIYINNLHNHTEQRRSGMVLVFFFVSTFPHTFNHDTVIVLFHY